MANKVVWPDEVVYTSQGQRTTHSELSVVLFVNCYVTMLAEEFEDIKAHMLQHIQGFMEDSGRYGWRSIRDYHAAWLQYIEQG